MKKRVKLFNILIFNVTLTLELIHSVGHFIYTYFFFLSWWHPLCYFFCGIRTSQLVCCTLKYIALEHFVFIAFISAYTLWRDVIFHAYWSLLYEKNDEKRKITLNSTVRETICELCFFGTFFPPVFFNVWAELFGIFAFYFSTLLQKFEKNKNYNVKWRYLSHKALKIG